MFALLAGYQYRSAAVVSDEPSPTDPDAVSLVEELRGQPGTRVPHAWVRDGVSTLDLLGSGFTVLTGDERWRAAAASASAALGVPITMHASVTTMRYRARATRSAASPPDDFVGWRTDQLPANPEAALHQALSAILSR